MAVTVKHPFVSTVPDSTDTSLVRPSNWNADHTITGLGTAAELNAGVANGVATLDSGGKVPVSQLPQMGDLNYQGTWNASTNTPTLASGTGTKGYYYVVNVAGTTNLDGITDWQVGDWAVFNGTVWQKVDNTDAVTSVNGYTGTVVLTQPDIAGTANSGTNTNITSMTGITGGISTADYVAFDTTYATTLTSGQLGWDGNNTLAIGMAGGNVVQHIGEDTFFYVKASSAITKGQVCMFTGAVGASGVVTAAPATGVSNGQYIMGIAAENIALNGFGLVQNFGEIRNVNTTGFTDGDVVYYDQSVTGGFTKTFPSTGPIVTVAAVVNGGSSGAGVLQVRVTVSERNIAGTGISVSQSSSGSTITNTAPDQTVVLTGGTGISTSGTYPNFTITNTAPSSGGTVTSITAGTGLSGGTITSSGTIAIDSTVATLTGSQILTNKTISGATNTLTNIGNSSLTNSSITINGSAVSLGGSTSVGTVTSVSGTAPISVATGTTTPAISISQASGTTNGYLSSTDWTTFNNKGSGSVTSVATGTGLTGGPITGSGTISLANTAVTAGSYTLASITVDAQGRITAASSGSAGSGTVTSVGMTTPTGLTVTGSPITTTGTLALTYTAGYSIPTTASQGNWDTAYTQRLQWDGGSTNLVAATGRTSLGGTTVGQNFFTLTNPSAITFPRMNADNTVSALDAATFRSAIGAGTGSGTVTSITAGTGLSGGTITTTGTVALANTAVTAGSYTYGSFTVDAQGRLTAASSGTAPVTSVSATSPVASSGGTTPTISMPAANTTTSGYLTSTDWNTFNGKGSGTVTSVSGTGTVAGLTLSGTVTSSGSLTLGGSLTIPSGTVTRAMMYTTSNDGNAVLCGADGAIFLNPNTINNSTTIPANYNGHSAGPITIATGVTVTVSTGSTWVIV